MGRSEPKLVKFCCIVALLCACSILGTLKSLSKQLVTKSRINIEEYDNSPIDYTGHNQSNSTEHEFCKEPTIKEFPDDFVPFKEFKYIRLLAHVFVVIYVLVGVSVVCDDFFVESLNKISKDLGLSEDVAGATFMAAGTSAPELFTSIIGVIVAKSDIGTGTIVGSAIFNVLFIISVCALAAKSTLNIDYYPISRDCLSYAISVIALILVLYDGHVTWVESIILLLLYAGYITIMYHNTAIEKWTKNRVREIFKEVVIVKNIEGSEGPIFVIEKIENLESSSKNITITEGEKDAQDDDEPSHFYPFKIPNEGFISKIKWLILLPLFSLIYITIPDTRRKRFEIFPYYFITFIISTIYIGIFTYILVWMVVIISYTVDIPDTVAGLTLLAAGTSLPEVVSSIIIARKGKGEMAISNSIGSNVFDILICLGLPWFLESVILKPFNDVPVYSGGILYSAMILLGSIFILVISFVKNKWRLTKKFGIFIVIVWLIVTVLTCLFEYDVFGKFSIPYCS